MSSDDGAREPTILETSLIVPTSDAELATDRLWRAGAQAVEEVDLGSLRLHGEEVVELRTVLADTEGASRDRLGALPSRWDLHFTERPLAPAQTWREFAQPIIVSPRLMVAPAWWEDDTADSNCFGGDTAGFGGDKILIEPGAAFGLGDHPTTRLMLEVIDELAASGGGLANTRVLDVGTGTGVLAVVAARLGASVTAIDVAPAAVEATQDNAQRNQVSVAASLTPLADIGGGFDVVLANILAPTLVELADDLQRVTAGGGLLVISGILADRYDHVVEALAPFEVVATRDRDGWSAVTLRHHRDR